MAHEIRVPEVSEGVVQGTVVGISVAVGDEVTEDQTLLELETDKEVVEIPSPFHGKITEIKVAEGDDVKVGAVIMILESSGPVAETPSAVEEDQAVAAGAEHVAEVPPVAEPESKSQAEPVSKTQAEPLDTTSAVDLRSVRRDDEVAPAAPSVRRMARELGVDIYRVSGSGPGGRISEADLRQYIRQTMLSISSDQPGQFSPGVAAGHQRSLPDFSKWGEITREPLSRVRELTADSMAYAWATIPMVTQYDQARITELEEYRTEFNRKVAAEAKLTVTAILLKVCAAALKAFPQFNSSLDLAGKQLILKNYVHIGVAVDTPVGLLVPVIHDVDKKGIETLALELNQFAAKARDRKLSPAEMEGGCFTISNLGGLGGTNFTPIVYAPQVAILGVSRAEMKPVWHGHEFIHQLVMPLSLTYDHRVIDGADGARFLRWICEAIEYPIQLDMKG